MAANGGWYNHASVCISEASPRQCLPHFTRTARCGSSVCKSEASVLPRQCSPSSTLHPSAGGNFRTPLTIHFLPDGPSSVKPGEHACALARADDLLYANAGTLNRAGRLHPFSHLFAGLCNDEAAILCNGSPQEARARAPGAWTLIETPRRPRILRLRCCRWRCCRWRCCRCCCRCFRFGDALEPAYLLRQS